MSKIYLLFCLVILMNSCGKQDPALIKTVSGDSVRKSDNKDTAGIDSTVKTYEGTYIVNLNTSSFRDCKYPDSVYWVIDETKQLQDLYKKTIPELNVYGSVYVKVKGELTRTGETKLEDRFPQTLLVKEVIAVERKNFRNTCVPYDFWCLGNEPNWSLQISQKENLIEFYLPEDKKIYYFSYAEPNKTDSVITYASFNPIQRYVIEISIRKEKCTDSVSKNVYDYSVEAGIRGGKKYKGCGIKGEQVKR